jgi:membrane protease YdiL (CAAX protease family)
MSIRLDELGVLLALQDGVSATGGMDQVEPPHFPGPLVGACLVAIAIGAAPLAWRLAAHVAGVGRSSSASRVRSVRWGLRHVVLVAGTIVALIFLSAFVWPPDKDDPDLTSTLVRTALALCGGALLIATIALRLGPDRWRSLGLVLSGSLRGAVGAWLAYVSAIPGILGLALLGHWLVEKLGIEFETQLVVKKFLELQEVDVPLVVVLGVLVMPFFEELTFRGFLQPVLVQRTGATLGIVFTSCVFAALHGASAFLPIFGLSLVLGLTMQVTGRLLASWAVHALHNGLVFGVLVFVRHHPELLGHSALLASR